jgi:hypothetical protein
MFLERGSYLELGSEFGHIGRHLIRARNAVELAFLLPEELVPAIRRVLHHLQIIEASIMDKSWAFTG